MIDVEVEWTTPDSALVREQGHERVLAFHVTSARWALHALDDEGHFTEEEHIEVDYEQRIEFTEERVRIARLWEPQRRALTAEWEGRVRMFRDETRDLAVMGARIALRKATKNL